MTSGIRATVEFSNPDICPIASVSASAGRTIHSVATTVCDGECEGSVTEFSTDGACDADADLTEVFSDGSTYRYRFAHDGGAECPCECLGEFGCPIARYVARDGTLSLTFHATDYEQLQAVVAALRDQFPEVDITRFVRSPTDGEKRDGVFLDRQKLTARQLEVLERAREMGYFDRPREANATEVAADLGIDQSTFQEHLAAAQAKVFEDVV